jgi:hypothetical protein
MERLSVGLAAAPDRVSVGGDTQPWNRQQVPTTSSLGFSAWQNVRVPPQTVCRQGGRDT